MELTDNINENQYPIYLYEGSTGSYYMLKSDDEFVRMQIFNEAGIFSFQFEKGKSIIRIKDILLKIESGIMKKILPEKFGKFETIFRAETIGILNSTKLIEA